ncbi:MAG: CopG family antitoxin [Chloroflexia bacterium]
MAESKTPKLPFSTIKELVEQFDDGEDMGEYLDLLPEAQFDVDVKKRTHMVAIDAELASKLAKIARQRQTSTGTLIDSWLREKIGQAQ